MDQGSRALTVLERVSSGVSARGLEPGPRLAPGSERPSHLLMGLFLIVYVAQVAGVPVSELALSGEQLAQGRWGTLVTHMFSHAGLGHLLANGSALLALGPPVMNWFGSGPRAWAAFLSLFLASGLFAAVLYLAIHPTGGTLMLGASGAIFGLWGAAARVGPDGGPAPLRSRQVRNGVIGAVLSNLLLLALLLGFSLAGASVPGLAWEAHLGGFLAGLAGGPWLKRRVRGSPGP